MEKKELLQTFYTIAPFLQTIDNFGWVPDKDGAYKIFPDHELAAKNVKAWFTPFWLNVETKVQSGYSYMGDTGVVRVGASI